jgi:hypothetical protein
VNVQEPVEPIAVKIHVTADPVAGVAVKVTEAPEVNPVNEISGVSSLVLLSVLDDPRSEPAAKSGVPGADKATVTVCVETADKFPAASTTYRTYVPGTKPVAATVAFSLAVEIAASFHKVPSAPVMLVRFEIGEILLFTR